MFRPWLIACLLMLVPSAVHAWNKAGHMATGAIAYQVLKAEDPKVVARVIALLKKHPEYDRWDKQSAKLGKVDREQFLFMQAARWPDDARDNPLFYPPDAEYDKLHYINFPYKPIGQPATVKTTPPADLNILRGYEDKLALLKGKIDADRRAVALCWIAHLVGDVHQPLHTTSLFTTRFPKGDRGGTLFQIRAEEGGAPISLHKYWDDLLLASENYTIVRNYATGLRQRKEFARANLTELAVTDFQQWAAKESFDLARDVVYRGGKLVGSTQKAKAEALPKDYARTVQPIAERRALLAGYRLAAVLKKALE